jgi:ABC-type nitrate/sulfonate/bicarbonate transport system substrate-binding protein
VITADFLNSNRLGRRSRGDLVRLGFVPLTDCAPLVVAQEFGLFARHGLNVSLSRELGWATVRNKLAHGELDAAHAPCGLPFALRLGLGCPATDCVASLIINLNGNGITLSAGLARDGVRDLASLSEFVRLHRRSRRLVFGVVSLHSTHAWLLRSWLASGGINPEEDVQLVVVPPPQMATHMASGNLDGFCVGEPWNSVAISRRVGWCAALSSKLSPGHPEKVLALRGSFAADSGDRPMRLTAALLEACMLCADPAHRDKILHLLSRKEYLALPSSLIAPALTERFPRGNRRVEQVPDLLVFHRAESNDPSTERAGWIVQNIFESSVRNRFTPLELGRVFRSDIFSSAQEFLLSRPRHELQTFA